MPRALRALLPHVTHLPHFLSVIVSHLPCASHALRSTWSRVSRLLPRMLDVPISPFALHAFRAPFFIHFLCMSFLEGFNGVETDIVCR